MPQDADLNRRRLLGVIGLTGLGALAGVAQAQPPEPPPLRGPSSRFSRVEIAIGKVKEARDLLEQTENIFGEHKGRALASLRSAIREMEEGIRFAREQGK